MAKSPNWTKEELDILIENYPKLGRCKELQELFPNRTMEGITLKASRIGLRVINNIREGRTNEEYLALLEKTNFVAMEPYKGSTVPILHMCGDCEYEWLARPQHVLRPGAKCPICSHKSRILTNERVDEVLCSTNLIRLSDYTGSLDKLLVQHSTCGYEWWTKYSYIEQGSGCPRCNRGYGTKYKNTEGIPDTASLYLFRISTEIEQFIKIGITCRPINFRQRELKSTLSKQYDNVTVELLYIVNSTGKNILEYEWSLLHRYPRYYTAKIFEGYSESLHISSETDIIKEMEIMQKKDNDGN